VYDVAADTWTQGNPSSKPSARERPALVYDSVDNKVVLFGGTDGTKDGETWVYDVAADTWTQKSPSRKPSERYAHTMAYEPVNNKAVLVGGYDDSSQLQDMWLYDYVTNNWSQKNPSAKPSKIAGHTLAYDSVNKKVVLFGGTDGTNQLSDTWTYSLNNYHLAGTYTSPTYAADVYRWHRITWAADTEPDGFVRFQVAVNTDGRTWDYVGPDGTSLTYYDDVTGGDLWSGYSGEYLRYRAYFTTSYPGADTPELHDVSITYLETPPTVSVLSPNGGEDVLDNEATVVTWEANGTFSSNPINLYYSVDGGATWHVMAADTANDGLHKWTTPEKNKGILPEGGTEMALVKVTAKDIYGNNVSDVSDMAFAIDPPPENLEDIPEDGSSPAEGDEAEMAEETNVGNSGDSRDLGSGGLIVLTVGLLLMFLVGYKKKKQALVVLVIFCLLGMPALLITPDAEGASWTQTSDTEFDRGSFENVEVVGTGDDAVLQLEKKDELGAWHEKGLKPDARYGSAIVYDSVNNKVVLFGGQTSSGFSDETWVYDVASDTWTQKNPATKPPALLHSQMTYDSTKNKVVLFGGSDGTNRRDETWVYDVKADTWTKMNPSTKPSGRSSHSMAYDSKNNVVVLFGGYDGSNNEKDDTWTYDVASDTWTQKSPSTKPSVRRKHVIVYDSSSNKIVLFGGDVNNNRKDDTWVYDVASDTWTQKSPSTKPSARSKHAMAYDSANNKVVLFGVFDGSFDDETWVYDVTSDTWTQKSPSTKPSVRTPHTMAYDSANNKVVLFGGASDGSYNNDTWLYDYGTNIWTERSKGTKPGARAVSSAHMVYDSTNDNVILFGGAGSGSERKDDTWLYDVSSDVWTQKSPSTKPSPRAGHTMVYDSANEKVVLFGGYDGSLDDETWVYDVPGDTWTQQNPGTKPAVRKEHGMAYDSANNKVVLFGGADDGGARDDTWVYDVASDTWDQKSPSTKPSARYHSGMAYDPENEKVILFGGTSGTDETWTYDVPTNTWTRKYPTSKPSARATQGMVYDSLNEKVVLFAGIDGSTYCNDTWHYDYATNNWTFRNPPSRPPSRRYVGMAYDATNGKSVMFGGDDGTNRLDDTWTYSLNNYHLAGTYTSPTYTANVYKWHRITWAVDTEPDGFVRFQVAVNSDGKTWNYVGPDGTSLTYYDDIAGGDLWSGYTGEYLRYRAYFTTSYPGADTPELHQVSITSLEEAPTVTLRSPNGGEDILDNEATVVTWEATGDFGSNPINLYYSVDGGANWYVMTADTANDGLYKWTVPVKGQGGIPAGGTELALVKVTAKDIYGNNVSDVSDMAFAIDPPPEDPEEMNQGDPSTPGEEEAEMTEKTNAGDSGDSRDLGSGGLIVLITGLLLVLLLGYRKKKKVLVVLVILCLLGMPVLLVIPEAEGGTWEQTSSTDFNSGTFENVEVVGTGDDAVLQLEKKDELGAWHEKGLKPSKREPSDMAYDSKNNRIVLFGGRDGDTYFSDTWVYDVASDIWTQKNPATKPSARNAHAMAYDSTNNKIVLFGGYYGSSYYDDTWVYDVASDTWTEKSLSTKPSARFGHAMAYDSTNNKIVLFSGAAAGYNDETWVYDVTNNSWTEKNPSTKPSGRLGHGFTYDSANNKVVLFDGYSDNKGDTWTYDVASNTWTEKNPSTKPSGRHWSGMAYDSVNEKIVLFGGKDNDDTWVYDLASNTWTEKNPSGDKPSGRNCRMAYDSANNKIVLFGGEHASSPHNKFNDTWLYDYTTNTWTEKSKGTKPGEWIFAADNIAYDSKNNAAVFFGGQDNNGYTQDTWVYYLDNDTWVDKTPNQIPASYPSKRNGHGMTYNSACELFVLFGGQRYDDVRLQDTWLYCLENNTWWRVHPEDNGDGDRPNVRTEHVLVYDSKNNAILLFGGQNAPTIYGDVWAYYLNNDTWWQKHPSGSTPSSRYQHGMAYDPENEKVIIFGGSPGGGTIYGDTWAYDTKTDKWEEMSPSVEPSDRAMVVMEYDSHNQKIVLFGGYASSSYYDDTWTYDYEADTWTLKNPPTSPSARRYYGLVYNSEERKTVFFAGQESSGEEIDDTWTYSLNNYHLAGTHTTPTYTADIYKWSKITWAADTEPDGFVRFQVAVNSDGRTWDYVGPDGTSLTYYDDITGGDLWSGHSGEYLRYRAYLTTSYPGADTPKLRDVSIRYLEEPPTVKVISPNGGEDILDNEATVVTWEANGNFGSNPVNLYYSVNGGTAWHVMAADTANDGLYKWTVPEKGQGGIPADGTELALVKVTAKDIYGDNVSDVSDMAFAIDPPPVNPEEMDRIISPASGDIIGQGPTEITWELEGPERASLFSSSDLGANWESIAEGVENTGHYEWNAPLDLNSRNMLIKIVNDQTRGNDIMSGVFTVDTEKPTINKVWTERTENGLRVLAEAEDSFQTSLTLFYKPNNGEYRFMKMTESEPGTFTVEITGTGTMDYYVQATDGANLVTSEAYEVELREEDASAGGVGFVAVAALMGILLVGIRKKDRKVLAVFIVLCLLGMPVFLTTPEVKGGTWTQTSLSDFTGGIFENVEIVGTGDDAVLQLEKKDELGAWHEKGLKPSKREALAMAYDSKTNKIVLFGGRDGSTYNSETWVYDVASDTWTQMSPSAKPSARCFHAMVYDPENGNVVLFGGLDASNNLQDTWVYNVAANTWTQKSPVTKPSARHAHAMVYDPDTKRIILFGGGTGSNNDETWVYDVTVNTWSKKSPSTKPSARHAHGMVYDTANNKVVLFGGFDGSTEEQDTWMYDVTGNIWSKKSPSTKPSGRRSHAMAYDPVNEKVVLFGGGGTSGLLDDTWVYDYTTNTWTNKTTSADKPPAGGYSGMVYDSASNTIVLFRGDGSTQRFDDTWLYDVATYTWTERSKGVKPDKRYSYSMAYDSVNNKVVLFGGDKGNDNRADDTWIYDVSSDTWTQKNPSTKPSAREGHAMVYDSANNKIILFGGYDSNGNDDETWVYDLAADTWTKKSPSAKPSARVMHTMA